MARHHNDRPLPPGLLVTADPARIAAHFSDLVGLQPIRHTPEGLICAPRCAPEQAARALERCPLPWRALAAVPGWPDPPAAWVAGWYRRSPDHAPAPAGVRELLQPPGEGFGPLGHATTALCLTMIDRLAPAPAIDAGCGSGLLAQAWAASGRGMVVGYDLDPRAVSQARAGAAAAGLSEQIVFQRGPLEQLAAAALSGRVLLANVPIGAHRALLAACRVAPVAAVLSGLRPAEVAEPLAAWTARGLRLERVATAGGFVALTLAGPR